jgi:hypothetical protein
MKTETIEYKDGDLGLRGHLAYDDQKSGKVASAPESS